MSEPPPSVRPLHSQEDRGEGEGERELQIAGGGEGREFEIALAANTTAQRCDQDQ